MTNDNNSPPMQAGLDAVREMTKCTPVANSRERVPIPNPSNRSPGNETLRNMLIAETQRATLAGYTTRARVADWLLGLLILALIVTLRWWIPVLLDAFR